MEAVPDKNIAMEINSEQRGDHGNRNWYQKCFHSGPKGHIARDCFQNPKCKKFKGNKSRTQNHYRKTIWKETKGLL